MSAARVFAPGKLVLTGAYAVLEGAPAIAVAVSRGAFADASRTAPTPTPEVREALGSGPAPHVDASAMFERRESRLGGGPGVRKLGLGASAAILVASIAVREAEAGADLADEAVRARIFERARAAHARAQGGGSGVDVAASVHGGTIQYVLGAPVLSVALPPQVRLRVFACETSARTSALRAEVARLAARDPGAHRACMTDLVTMANDAARAVYAGEAKAFLEALRRTARGLARLGDAARVAIVPAGFEALEALAAREEAAFAVSGAGGGDVAVYAGHGDPSSAFVERALSVGLRPLDLGIDDEGVRIAPAISAVAEAPDAIRCQPRQPLEVDLESTHARE